MEYRGRLVACFALFIVSLSLSSCGPGKPPTREELFQESLTLETIYLTEDGREIKAPGNRDGVIIDPETKTMAWAAHQCDNPECPGERKGDRPFLFPRPQPFAFIKDDGTIGFGSRSATRTRRS